MAIIFWKSPNTGIFISILMILSIMVLNIFIADHYDLKIGFFNHTTYKTMIEIISKPWTKIQNLG